MKVTGNKWAILIGINEYRFLNDLNYCGADVEALGKRLKTAGYSADRVIAMHDNAERALLPQKENIEEAISNTIRKVRKGDLVIMAFSGHGVRVDRKSYLCPYRAKFDGKTVDGDTLIPLD